MSKYSVKFKRSMLEDEDEGEIESRSKNFGSEYIQKEDKKISKPDISLPKINISKDYTKANDSKMNLGSKGISFANLKDLTKSKPTWWGILGKYLEAFGNNMSNIPTTESPYNEFGFSPEFVASEENSSPSYKDLYEKEAMANFLQWRQKQLPQSQPQMQNQNPYLMQNPQLAQTPFAAQQPYGAMSTYRPMFARR